MGEVSIHFLGAAGTVTGSKYYLETPELNIMVDCGLFQGIKDLRQRNWEDLPIPVSQIDILLLTHGHLDHCGYLPRLYQMGFRGRIYGTGPTLAIAQIILDDTAKIQEEEAVRANREGYSKHHPALPLYTAYEVEQVAKLMEGIEKDRWISLSNHIRCRFRPVGHILGACFIELEMFGKQWIFSGDIGRKSDLLLADPLRPRWADFLVMESTYGDRDHPDEDADAQICQLVKDTIHQRGTLLIPSFAVERLQSLIFRLFNLYRKNLIPNIPIIVDSPMGQNVLEVFRQFGEWHHLPVALYEAMVDRMRFVQSYAETWEVIDDSRPKIVIAGSGMVTGGRILTYLDQLIDREDTTVLLVGFMAEGTRGRQLLEGASELKFFGRQRPVKARIRHLESLSAHADRQGLIWWLGDLRNIPERIFLVHGEPEAREAFGRLISERFGWNTTLPELNGRITLNI